jgi:hypothetical protein
MSKLLLTNGSLMVNVNRWGKLIRKKENADSDYIFVNNNLTAYLKVIAAIVIYRLKASNLRLICLELYNLSITCFLKEKNQGTNDLFQSLKIYAHLLFLFLILYLARSRYIGIIQASEPRARLYRRLEKYKNTSYQYNVAYVNELAAPSTNLPLLTEKPFWLLAGQVNDFEALKRIILLAASKGRQVVILGGEDISVAKREELIDRYSHLHWVGSVSHDLVFCYLKKAEKAVCLYSSNTPNQKYSSSSKAFEYANFEKPIIANDNHGLLDMKNRFSLDITFV